MADWAGCPFTKVPAGNVSTEDLVHSFQRMGLRTDIDLDALLDHGPRRWQPSSAASCPGLVLRSGSIVGFQGQPSEEGA